MQITVLSIFAVVMAIILYRMIRIVPQKQVIIVERLGRFHYAGTAGINIIIPFLDSIRSVLDVREQMSPIEPQSVISRDNVTMQVDAVIFFLIVDPIRATYEVQNLRWGIEQLTLSALRNVIGSLDLDHTLTSRDTINTQIRSALDQATQPWGVKIIRVELKNINPPDEIKLTMEKQMTAERTRRAVVTTAEGEKASAILKAEGLQQSQIIRAEGEKQSAILSAEGEALARLNLVEAEAKSLTLISQALGQSVSPAQYLIAQKYLQSLSDIASKAESTVFLPYEASSLLGSLGGLKKMFDTVNVPKQDS